MSFHEVQSIFSPNCPSDSRSVAHDPGRQLMKWMKPFFKLHFHSFIHSLAKLRLFTVIHLEKQWKNKIILEIHFHSLIGNIEFFVFDSFTK